VSKVLLLTASFGDGHNQAAYAVNEALERRGVTVRVIDYVEWLNPALRSVAKFSLLQGVRKVPELYGLFYRSMSKIPPSSSVQKRLNHLGSEQMLKYLDEFNPDLVASTFPTPTGVMSELRGSGVTDTPNVAILTDYTAHGQWVHKYVDKYFVATETVKSELESCNVDPKYIHVSGIPIRSMFDYPSEQLSLKRHELRAAYGIKSDSPLILMMGGGAGLLGDITSWEQVIQSSHAQFTIICGRNQRLYKRLSPLASGRVRILGYVSEVDEWMAMSDLIITKAGGITLTESLAMELPLLLYRPIPGQEEKNALYALQAGAARLFNDVDSARLFLDDIMKNPKRLERMKNAACHHKQLGAAEQIAEALLDFMGNKTADTQLAKYKANQFGLITRV
jgi:processive 1,2-diacylglycerol beta-glucosyltransferase